MGCGAGGKKPGQQIPYKMEILKAESLNTTFNKLSSILQRCEEFRKGFAKPFKHMREETCCACIDQPKLIDAIKIWLWALACWAKGGILKMVEEAKILIIFQKPYFVLLITDGLSLEVINFLDNFRNLFENVMTVPSQLEGLMADVKAIVDELTPMATDPKGTIEKNCSGLDIFAIAGEVKGLLKNIDTAKEGFTKLQNVLTVLKEGAETCKELGAKFKDIMKEANEISTKAIKENKTLFSQLVTYHPRFNPNWWTKREDEKKHRESKKKK